MADQPPPLQYGRPTLRLRRWAVRVALLAWAGLTVYLLHDKWGAWFGLQSALLAAQRDCAGFVEPREKVVYEGDEQRAGTLLPNASFPSGAERYRRVVADRFSSSGYDSPAAASVAADAAWAKLTSAQTNLEWWDARDLPPEESIARAVGDMLEGGMAAAAGPDEFLIFLHERRAPAGDRRLVAVFAQPRGGGSVGLRATVWSKAGLFARPKLLHAIEWPSPGGVIPGPGADADDRAIRLFAPQPDAADRSRFTIPFETRGGQRGTLAGRLTAQDQVEFRATPDAAPPAQR